MNEPAEPEAQLGQPQAPLGTAGVSGATRKRFLLQTAKWAGLTLGGVAALAGLIWLNRVALGERTLQSILVQRGVESQFTVKSISSNQISLNAVTLGKVAKPTFAAKEVVITFHTRLFDQSFIIDDFRVNDATLHLALDDKGQINFGALAPFMVKSNKPSKISVVGGQLQNGTILVDSPAGPSQILASLAGDGSGLWKANLLLTPPPAFQTLAKPGERFKPIALDIKAQVAKPGEPASIIDFALRPDGQSLKAGTTTLNQLTGRLSGRVLWHADKTLAISSAPSMVRAQRASIGGAAFTNLTLNLQQGFWQQRDNWGKDGYGSLIAEAAAAAATLPAAQQSTGAVQFKLAAARTQQGKVRLDYALSAAGLNGQLKSRGGKLSGMAEAIVQDLQHPGYPQASVQVAIALDRVTRLGPLTKENFSNLGSTVAANTGFQYKPEKDGGTLTLDQPLLATSSKHLQLSLTPQLNNLPSLKISNEADSKMGLRLSGGARVDAALPGQGRGQALIDNVTYSNTGANPGWAIQARAAVLEQVALSGAFKGLTASAALSEVNLSARNGQGPSGKAKGTLIVTGKRGAVGARNGQAALQFSLQGDGAKLASTLSGTVTGFGINGAGIQNGRIIGQINANRRGTQWSASGSSQISSDTIRSADLLADSLVVAARGTGQLTMPSQSTALHWAADVGLAGNANNLAAHDFKAKRATVAGPVRMIGSADRLSIKSNIQAQASTLAYGNLDTQGFSASLPMDTVVEGGNWRSSGRYEIATRSLTFEESHFSNLRLTGTMLGRNVASASTGDWKLDTDFQLAASSFKTGESVINGLRIQGPVSVTSTHGNGILATAQSCLTLNAANGQFPGDATVGEVRTTFCPDAAKRLAGIRDNDFVLYADARFEPLDLQLGNLEDGRSIQLGAIRGDFKPAPSRGWLLDLTSTNFGIGFKLADGSTGYVKSGDARLRVNPGPQGIALTGELGKLSADGLPVLLSGSARTNLVSGSSGLVGTIKFDDIYVKDVPTYETALDANGQKVPKAPRFADLLLVGEGTIDGNRIDLQSDVLQAEKRVLLARAALNHDSKTGLGRIDALADNLKFGETDGKTNPLDAADLVPTLRGVILDMVGSVTGSASVAWAPNQPVASEAKVSSSAIDFSTQIGRVEGAFGTLDLEDLFTARSRGPQTFKITRFDPGISVERAIVSFTLPGNNTIQLNSAKWPFADGELAVRPAIWTFRDGDQAFAIDVNDVDIGAFLKLNHVPNLEVDAKMSGVLPIEITSGNIVIAGGLLKAREGGGVIRYTGPGLSPPPPPASGVVERARAGLFGKTPRSTGELAVEALRALEFKVFELTVDGRITGDLSIGVILEGANKQLLSGIPFRFNIKAKLPVGQLTDFANSVTTPNENILKELLTFSGEVPELNKPAEPAVEPPKP